MKRREFLHLLPLFCSAVVAREQRPRTRIILDTDIGEDIDDAWALGLAITHNGFDLLGVTITHGNTPARAKIACKLLNVAGRRDVPVFIGRKTNDKVFAQFSWAEDFSAVKPAEKTAADFIVDAAKRHPGEVTLVGVGPLENIADALRKEPGLGRYLKRVVLMSGCVYGASFSPGKPVREWNVYQSTADARLVYDAGLPITIVPLDSTSYVRLGDPDRKRIAEHGSPLTDALERLYRLWLTSPTDRMTLHDQLAVAEAAIPGAFFGRRESLSLVVDEEGYTRIDNARGKVVSVCMEPRRDEFMEYFCRTLTDPK